MPIYHRRIFEHLGETLDFLKAHFRLKFCVFQLFYYLRKYAPCTKDAYTSFPSCSKYGVFT